MTISKDFKKLNIILPLDIYKKLKRSCVGRDIFMKEYIAELIDRELKKSLQDKEPGEKSNNNKPEMLELIRSCDLFLDLDAGELAEISKGATWQRFAKGHEIVHEGEETDLLYFITKGSVKISKHSFSGKEVIIDIRNKGDTVAFVNGIAGGRVFFTATALENVTAIAIKRAAILALIERKPTIILRILSLQEDRINHIVDKMLSIVSERVQSRVIRTLDYLCQIYGNELPFTHFQIALMDGSTNETITRVLKPLKTAGIINSLRGKILIRDKDKLKALIKNNGSM